MSALRAASEVEDPRLRHEVWEALRARDRVLGVVAHDLRNPLGTILMSVALLLDSDLGEEQRTHQLQVIRRSAQRMNHLIQDLLDVTRIEAGRLGLQCEHQDPTRIVREAVVLNVAQAAAKSLVIRCDAVNEGPPVLADRDRILQVLANLIDNAIKFTPEGGSIVVSVESAGGEARFVVSDTGSGISPEDLEEIFRPFWQTRRGSMEGAGLGLAIARGIVEAHGGRIGAASRVGEGSTFWFSLPLATERRKDADPAETRSEKGGRDAHAVSPALP